jgi:DNA topoisomerase-1
MKPTAFALRCTMRIRPLPTAGLTPEELARLAQLRYVSDQDAGYVRERRGQRFVYLDHRGRRLVNAAKVARIDQLAIPPAWRDVWICRYAKGHLQATGRDSRKRKQYVYHARWNEISNLAKFWRLGAFGQALPSLRRRLARSLTGNKLSRDRMLAGIVGLLDATSIRIGNEEYVAQNGSYGLTTLRDRHVEVSASAVELRFVGKGGFRKQVAIVDKLLVRLVKQARMVPGPRLFQYVDDQGRRRAITAGDVNDYLRDATGEPFTAKDFRTWKASAMVAGTLYEYRELDRMGLRRRLLKTVVEDAAASLGNTPTICRNYYIHPGLMATYQDGSLSDYFSRFAPKRRANFSREEQVLERFLSRWEADRERGA